MRRWIIIILVILLNSCIPIRPTRGPVVKTEAYPRFRDTEPLSSLRKAITNSLKAMSGLDSERTAALGQRSMTVKDLEEALSHFLVLLEKAQDEEDLSERVRKDFDLYEVSGPVLFTGYYEPLLQGSPVQTERFHYPLYRRPHDLNQTGDDSCMNIILPLFDNDRAYYSRRNIDSEGVLSRRGLELLYLDDPVERFFLHVQGAGSIELPDGSVVRVQYDGSNRRPYTSIGRILVEEEKLLPGEADLPGIKAYLRAHPEEQERIMNRNERYIFFKLSDAAVRGVLDVELTPLRSLATAPAVIPTGSLCYYVTRFPLFDEKGELTGWKEQAGFAVSQDVGKAIQGPNRADIFLGSGPRAEATAGDLRSLGRLYILVKSNGVGVN